MEKLKKRIKLFKEKRPGYGEILDFYQKVKETQEKARSSLKIDLIHFKNGWKELLAKEGFSLIQKEEFPLDIVTSINLFHSLCQIGKDANPYLSEQIRRIEDALVNKRIDLEELLKKGFKEREFEKIASKLELDKKVFLFLIHNSIKPSVEAGLKQIRNEIDNETWLKSFCPICGSPPCLSLLKEEVGKRFLLCSFCENQWRIDRLICPFCNSKEQESLHYLSPEGEEAYRIDLCDKCHQYIKTIDLRKTEAPDLLLEDLATLHLDFLAIQRGYQRPVPNPWIN